MIESLIDFLVDKGINPICTFAAIGAANATYLLATNTPERKRQKWQQHYVWSAVVTTAVLVLFCFASALGIINF